MRDYVHERRVPTIITQATANNLTTERASPTIFAMDVAPYITRIQGKAQDLDTAENKRFVQAFNRKYRKDPVYNNHLGYLAARAAGETIKAVGGNVVDRVAGKLQNTVIDVVPDVDQFWKPPKR
jgi:ABC-type branched-subunit amino acid transport system substrate-binding protein